MTETHTPLPCPFCGGPAEKYESAMAQIYSFGCADENECASAPSSGTFPTEAEALTAWNTRAVNSHHDLIEALRALTKEFRTRCRSFDNKVLANAEAILTKAEAGHG